ncbi:prostaglandin-H2 D-isomerase-like isoform X1 [Hemibagrus wyckioides]|nr:prostaglandin-H2 D-isomerase-like isoform X1 [Hemibagrus wyckioides]
MYPPGEVLLQTPLLFFSLTRGFCSALLSSIHSGVTMATTMLGLLGVFLFIFTTNTQLQVSADFNISKVEGKWYQTGVATNAKWFTDSKWMKKVSVAILTPTANGDVNMNGSVILTENSKDTSCLRFNLFLKKTKTTGKFILYNTRFQTRNDL